MALIQTIGERTYTYDHCIGSLFAFTAPTDLVLGGKGRGVCCQSWLGPGVPPGRKTEVVPSGTWKKT